MKIRLRLALISIALTAASMAVCDALLLNATAKSNLTLAEENARAMAFGPLNDEQLRQIDEALGA